MERDITLKWINVFLESHSETESRISTQWSVVISVKYDQLTNRFLVLLATGPTLDYVF